MNGRIDVDFFSWLFGCDGPVVIQLLYLHIQGVHLGGREDLVPGLSQGIHALPHLFQELRL